ncbi:MAG TPA: CPBP family glutamic-type intramembrane protease [Spirochaetota bacterium]|nr:CPBP family glutamic-type intramembrane protease [Spirochaetota bacterium]HPQ55232.1 CPBP family glutamic-type intramembrane protease [Spirochaetota bacterium]
MAITNQYAFNKPPARILLSIPVLFLFGYLAQRYSGFSYVYQYAISVVLTIFISLLFDKDIVSLRRIASRSGHPVERISVFLFPVIVVLCVYFLITYAFRTSLMYPAFSSHGRISGYELFPLMFLIVVPMTEIFFRGFLQRNLSGIIGEKAGFILTAIVFAGFAWFSGSKLLIAVYLVLGLYLGYLYYKYQSVFLTIINHALVILFMFVLKY